MQVNAAEFWRPLASGLLLTLLAVWVNEVALGADSETANETDANPFAPAIQVTPTEETDKSRAATKASEAKRSPPLSQSEHKKPSRTTTVPPSQERLWSLSSAASLSSDPSLANPSASIGLSYRRPWQDFQVSGNLSFLKKFYIYPSEDELVLNDPSLGISRELFRLAAWFPVNGNLSMTLPLSEFSRENSIISRISAGLSGFEQILDKRLGLSYAIRSTLHLSEYETTKGGDGLGGSPLPIWSYSLQHAGEYQLGHNWSCSYSLAYSEVYYYDLDPNESEALTAVDLPDQSYNLSTGVNWQAQASLRVGLGYNQGSQILYPGLQDFVLYDEDLSQWYLSLEYIY